MIIIRSLAGTIYMLGMAFAFVVHTFGRIAWGQLGMFGRDVKRYFKG
jgi:hypothetical protein